MGINSIYTAPSSQVHQCGIVHSNMGRWFKDTCTFEDYGNSYHLMPSLANDLGLTMNSYEIPKLINHIILRVEVQIP